MSARKGINIENFVKKIILSTNMTVIVSYLASLLHDALSCLVSYLEPEKMEVTKITKQAVLPKRATPGSAGFDLYSAVNTIILKKDKTIIPTDIKIKLPKGCYGRIAPRSGLTKDYFIDVGAGVIDSDFRGNVSVVLFNFGNEDFRIKQGDRVAQLICEKIRAPGVKEVQTLNMTERNENGWGSTGFNSDLM